MIVSDYHRLGWVNHVERREVEVQDCILHIQDGDDRLHTLSFKGVYEWEIFDWGPYTTSGRDRGLRHIKENEFIRTDNDDVLLARCNIKVVTFQDAPPRMIEATWIFYGMKHWGVFAWVCFFGTIVMLAGFVAAFTLT